ncbi:unnamed protein product [Sympodiomycopsis kandeliae]
MDIGTAAPRVSVPTCTKERSIVEQHRDQKTTTTTRRRRPTLAERMSLPQEPAPDSIPATLEEGPGRYAVFANRLRTAFTAGLRYSAYSSELGEAFRPLTKPIVVRSLYGISWSYIIGDVAYSGYQARETHRHQKSILDDPSLKLKFQDHDKSNPHQDQKLDPHHRVSPINPLDRSENTHIALTCTRRAVFQSLASMALPAFTVHSIVHYSQPLFKKIQNHRIKALGPTILGLSIIPLLPVMFDEPVEHVIDGVFDWGEMKYFSSESKEDIVQEVKTALKEKTPAVASGAAAAASCVVVARRNTVIAKGFNAATRAPAPALRAATLGALGAGIAYSHATRSKAIH